MPHNPWKDPNFVPTKDYVRKKIRRNNEVGFSKDILTKLAAKKREELKIRQLGVDVSTLGLLDLVPATSQYLAEPLERPTWLLPLVNVFEHAIVEGGERGVMACPPQHGKAVADDTPMLTRCGWIAAGKVVVGDELIGADGRWTRVLAVHPQGEVPLFRVSFTDGSSLVTCAEHRWQVRQRYSLCQRILTTAELSADITESDGRHKWRIPVVEPIQGEEVELPVDPYVLGAWLGDGHAIHGAITSADQDVVSAVAAAGFVCSRRRASSSGKASTYGVLGLQVKLRQIGVLGHKHIPGAYFRGTVAQRLALLQGLCDTDGTVARNGSQQSFCSTSERLASDFKLLVNSLGGVCTDLTRRAAEKIAHNIYFRLPHGMRGFRLDRKQLRLNADSQRTVPRRFVCGVEPVGSGPATCFTVDATDHLFCAGRDLIVTHNSVLVQHALLRAALIGLNPAAKITKRHAYITYNADRAEKVSRQFQQIAEAVGLKPQGKLGEVQLKGGTEVLFTSIGGSLTGFAVDGLMIIDDPHKDRIEAESPTLRLRVCDWFSDVARSRRHERTSIIVIATRWHPEDLSGDRIRSGYPYINLKAIAEGPVDDSGRVAQDPLHRYPGEALWHKKPAEFFAEEREDPYTWASLYQGEPRGRGNTVFNWPDLAEASRWYDPRELPPRNRLQISVGCDFSYTSKTWADWSAAVVVGRHAGKTYVLDVIRAQEETRVFRNRLMAVRAEWPDAEFLAYVGGAERGGADFIREAGIPIRALSAQKSGDKFARAIPVAAAWNTGRLLLPKEARWLDTFLSEVCSFTGVKDRHDDQVDALASAWNGLDSDDELLIGAPARSRGWM